MSNLATPRLWLRSLSIFAVWASISACGPAVETAAPEAASENPPSPAPAVEVEVFGEGVVSTRAPEFAITLAADGATVFFNRASDDRTSLAILVAELRDGAWSSPGTASFSGTYRDVDPFLSEDGQRLYYSSNRPLSGEEGKDFDIWFVAREGDGWSEPVNLGEPVNTGATEIYATFAGNGNVYFSSDRGGEDAIYRSRWEDGAFGEPERLDLGDGDFSNPCIAGDESFLIVSGELSDGAGASDLYVSFARDGAWTAPENLAAINTPWAEFAPALSVDGRTLFFTSERPGLVGEGEVDGRPPGDIYRVDLSAVLEAPE